MEAKKSETTTKATPEKNKPAQAGQSQLNIFQRLLAATSEIGRVAKNLKVDVTKTSSYKAVAEADVLEAVKPVEEKYGIYSYPVARNIIKDEVFTTAGQYGERNSFFMRVETTYRFVNVDNPTEYIDITTYGDGVDTQDKAPGKAMTYGDKYALLKGYKIQTGDDPDANASGDLKGKPKGKTDVSEDKSKPTPELLKQAQEYEIDLSKLAVYMKCKVEDISANALAEAIEMKKRSLAKQQQKAAGVKNDLAGVKEKHHTGDNPDLGGDDNG